MADNYLERRMEELRSGKLAVKNRRPGIKAGSRRVAVAGGCHGSALDKVLEYRREGCRVALFDSDAEAGKKLAYEHGVRFHRVDTSDATAIEKELNALLQTWRGIDVIVGLEEECSLMNAIIRKWKELLPIPDKTDPEIVIIANRD